MAPPFSKSVSLFTREWIEILTLSPREAARAVSLFTREWIEIAASTNARRERIRLPLYEGVD